MSNSKTVITTVSIPSNLKAAAKEQAKKEGRSLSNYLVQLLKQALS